MGAIYIGIGHDDDLVITKFGNIKIIMNTCTKSCDHGLDFFISVDSVQSGLFNIQDFSPKRKDCLRITTSGCFSGTTGGISLHQINLTFFRIFVCTVSQFTRKGHTVQCRFSAGKISGFSGSFSGPLRKHRFFNNGLGNHGILLQKQLELCRNNIIYCCTGFAVAKLLFCLSFKLRFFNLNADNCRQTFTDIFTGQILIAVF